MAHVTETAISYNVNDSTDTTLHQPAHTSMWSALRGNPRSGGKGWKMAMVTLDWTATLTYSTGGINVDLLSNLPGWENVLIAIGVPYYNSTSTAAWERPVFIGQDKDTATGSRLMMCENVPAGEAVASEIADDRALPAEVEVLVIGY